VNIPVIASGGIRNGIDIVKSLVLGASMAGLASPFLRHMDNGYEGLKSFMDSLVLEVRMAMLLTGCEDIDTLRRVPRVLTGPLREWYLQRCVARGDVE